ncbi:12715_t:CDS:1, partial [Gigaspora margarita]
MIKPSAFSEQTSNIEQIKFTSLGIPYKSFLTCFIGRCIELGNEESYCDRHQNVDMILHE